MAEILPTPIKGNADWRDYRVFRLDNGVTCMVIHDKESKTTAAACCVDVGASSDPRSLSGLAHFCEHMCFLGSTKYPGENEYKRYLASHGGRSNASTSMYLTNYKFEVVAEHAEKAIDIFSNFFISPLFTSSGTGREVQAVDSENSKNLVADGRRRLQILKALADQNHYYSKFTTGNSITLPSSDDNKVEWIRDALFAFHRKHYRPEKMTVVVAGPQSLDTLQDWIAPRFGQIKAKSFPESNELTETEKLIAEAATHAPNYAYDQPVEPYNPPFQPSLQGGWPVLLTTKPLRSMRKLVLMFPMPSDRRAIDRAPSSVLSHLLGHEGVGSAFAVLQDRGLLSSLSAGSRTRGPDFNLFHIDIGLTEQGEKNWKEVVGIIFAYCRLIHEKALKAKNGKCDDLKRIWGEMSKLNAMFFHSTSPGGVYNYAPNLVERIVSYGPEKCLSAGSMLDEDKETFPLDEVLEISKLLIPTNCLIERCSESAWEEMESESNESKKDWKKTEKWYGVDYFVRPIDESDVKLWEGIGNSPTTSSALDDGQLHLPKPNRYIPRSLDLNDELPEEAKAGPRIEKEIDPPNMLPTDNPNIRLFHRLDDRYALPQSSLSFLIRTPKVKNVNMNGKWEYHVETAIMSSFVSEMFSEALAQETYDADLAGLYWSLQLTSSGVKLGCFGFSDRLSVLALKVLGEFLSGDFLQDSYFTSTNDRVIRGLRTFFESRRADSHAIYYRDSLLGSMDDGVAESLKVAESTTLDSVRAYHKQIFKDCDVEIDCLFTGNVSSGEAKQFLDDAIKLLRKDVEIMATEKPSWYPGLVERRLHLGEDIELHFPSKNPEELNGAVVFTYQSQIPAFKGSERSHPSGLHSTASIRLLCHMLREPLFDDLRTKQQLGYVVTSYYENGISSRQFEQSSLGPLTVPVDYVTISVLSRKVSPPEVAQRIEEFLVSFRESLLQMPESEIEDHALALSTKLLKPIPKLQTEASNHFSKILRYAPEVLYNGGKDKDLPWSSTKDLAQEIKSLKRSDLIQAWDRLVQPTSRSRIVCCVYGKTFPLPNSSRGVTWSTSRPDFKVVDNFQDLMQLRKQFVPYDDTASKRLDFMSRLKQNPIKALTSSNRMLAILGIGVLGAGYVGLTMVSRNKKDGGSVKRFK